MKDKQLKIKTFKATDGKTIAIDTNRIGVIHDQGTHTLVSVDGHAAMIDMPHEEFLKAVGWQTADDEPPHVWGPFRVTRDHSKIVQLDENGNVLTAFEKIGDFEAETDFQRRLNFGTSDKFAFVLIDLHAQTQDGKKLLEEYYFDEQ